MSRCGKAMRRKAENGPMQTKRKKEENEID